MNISNRYGKDRRSLIATSVVFLLVIATALLADFAFFFHDHILPFTDYAANDILVVQAKHLSLWHGNYSRVGFYHPGPFYLQLMAASEFLFHDSLPIFASAFAAQVFAIVLLSGLSFGLLAKLVTELTGKVMPAVAGVAVLVLLLMRAEAYGFLSPWPPYMYTMSAVILATALCGVVAGRWNWLPWLMIGAGSLVHGHASFVGLVPVMLCVAMVSWYLVQRLWGVVPLTLPSKKIIGLSLVLGMLFLLPIVLQTLIYWPGELPKYFGFAGQRAPNSPMAVARYLSGFLPLLPLGLVAVVSAGWLGRRDGRARAVIAGGLVFCAGTVAAAFYARSGVDDVSFKYLEYWYVPFYAVPVAVAMGVLLEKLALRQWTLTALASVSLVAIAGYAVAKVPLALQRPQSQPVALFDKAVNDLKRVAGQKPIVLQLDNAGDVSWGASWTDAVTLIAYVNRTHAADICIDPATWHLLFHAKYRCDDKRLSNGVKLAVTDKARPGTDQLAALSQTRIYPVSALAAATGQDSTAASISVDEPLPEASLAPVLALVSRGAVPGPRPAIKFIVSIRNGGTLPLAGKGSHPVNLAVVALAPGASVGNQAAPRREIQRVPLPGIAPGSTAEVKVVVPLQQIEGIASLRIELVQEGVAWFTYNYNRPQLDLPAYVACGQRQHDVCERNGSEPVPSLP